MYILNWFVGVVIVGVLYYGFSVVFKVFIESLIDGLREDRVKEWLLIGISVMYGVEDV